MKWSWFTIIVLCLIAPAGCHSRPVRVQMRGDVDGNMNMTGNMNVTGDTTVKGDVAMSGDLRTSFKTDNTASPLDVVVVQGDPNCPHRVAVIDVDGLLLQQNLGGIGSMGENPVALFREKLDRIATDDQVRSIVLRIDSPGGGVAAVDQMCHDLQRFRTARGIPVVACVLGTGTGGAYLLATHADQIIAQPTSIVGGIGVILNLYNMEDTLGQYNIAAIPIKAGDSIDAGNPTRAMNPQEREHLQRIADSFQDRFTTQVLRSRRSLRAPADRSDVDAWFDGRVVTGDAARRAGLIDAVGYLDDAIERATAMAAAMEPIDGRDARQVAVVMLRRDNDRAHTPLDVTPNSSSIGSLLPISLPGLERDKLPTFLYLWQLDPTLAASAR